MWVISEHFISLEYKTINLIIPIRCYMKRIVLDKKFQKYLFEKLLKKFDQDKLTKKLGVNSASIYHMKNGRINSIDLRVFGKIQKILGVTQEEVASNTIKIISRDEILKGLAIGRSVRTEQLKKWRREIPSLEDLVEDERLNLEKWFYSYRKLMDFGSRQIIEIKKQNNRLIMTYTNYSNGRKKRFTNTLPRKISIDKRFQYFFGLWCGDKAGGGRIGVANKAIEINLLTERHLENLYQKPVFQMLLSSNEKKIPDVGLKVDEIVRVKNMPGDYVMVIFAVNSILKSFFNYLLENLDKFLSTLPNKELFFAGLFDAEGNVSLEDRYFRWSCKNMKEVEIYKKHLSDLGLFKRYDGSSLITDNREAFLSKIYPNIINKAKINRINLLFFDDGYLEDRFKSILICINDNPGRTVQEINNMFSRKKMWPQLKFLHGCEYLRKEGYPMKLYITNKGLQEIGREGR